MNDIFNGMMGKLTSGVCKISMNGNIAVHTSTGYKSYNVETGRLTNCDNMVLPIGDQFFFVVPTNKVEKGDLIIVKGVPRCVVKAEKDRIEVINYENSTVETIIPERHMFLGNTYFYGKIVSMFGDNSFMKSGKGKNNILKFMAMSSLFGGNEETNFMSHNNQGNPINMMMSMMMMKEMDMGEMFGGVFSDLMEENTDKENE